MSITTRGSVAQKETDELKKSQQQHRFVAVSLSHKSITFKSFDDFNKPEKVQELYAGRVDLRLGDASSLREMTEKMQHPNLGFEGVYYFLEVKVPTQVKLLGHEHLNIEPSCIYKIYPHIQDWPRYIGIKGIKGREIKDSKSKEYMKKCEAGFLNPTYQASAVTELEAKHSFVVARISSELFYQLYATFDFKKIPPAMLTHFAKSIDILSRPASSLKDVRMISEEDLEDLEEEESPKWISCFLEINTLPKLLELTDSPIVSVDIANICKIYPHFEFWCKAENRVADLTPEEKESRLKMLQLKSTEGFLNPEYQEEMEKAAIKEITKLSIFKQPQAEVSAPATVVKKETLTI